MKNPSAVCVATAVAVVCLCAGPAAPQAHDTNRYGKQQLAQKQNRYGSTAWPSAAVALYGGTMTRHYPVPAGGGRYVAIGGRPAAGDDYGYPYGSRAYGRPQDYAVVRYPSYGGGYYSAAPAADLQYDEDGDDDGGDDDEDGGDELSRLYDDATAFGGRDPVAAAYSSSAYSPSAYSPSAYSPSAYTPSAYTPYYSAAAYNRYRPAAVAPPPPPPPQQSAAPRYHPPADKIHKFRRVFMSNLVSPSNAFKSTKEQQLYDFWESLINGDLQGPPSAADPRQQYARDAADSVASQLYQHLPPVFQQLQQQQKLRQQQQQQQRSSADPDHRGKSSQPSQPSQSSPSSHSAYPPTSSSQSSAASLQTVPRGNLYKQWADGSPLIKRSSPADVRRPAAPASAATPDSDDVRQLEKLKTAGNATAAGVTATAVAKEDAKTGVAAATLMADGGQREYVLPRPAGEKSGFESLLEVIAEGGLRGNEDENTAEAYKKFRQEAKVNKKRSYVSDETSLAAQLGALRKN